jgi:hypothetical protein
MMNSFTFIPGTGNFVDGGLSENMGLTALMELYSATDSLVQHSPWLQPYKDRIKIHFIFVTNNALVSKSRSPESPKVTRLFQPLALLSFTGSASINGTTTYFMAKTEKTLRPPAALHEFWLQSRDSVNSNIPLGRWLARRTVDSTECRLKQYDATLNQLVAPLRLR